MYIGNAVDTVLHEHHAIQIAISFDGPIDIIQSGSITKLKAVIIDSDQEHECRTYQSDFTILLTLTAPLKKCSDFPLCYYVKIAKSYKFTRTRVAIFA